MDLLVATERVADQVDRLPDQDLAGSDGQPVPTKGVARARRARCRPEEDEGEVELLVRHEEPVRVRDRVPERLGHRPLPSESTVNSATAVRAAAASGNT